MARLQALSQPQPLARMAYQALRESIIRGDLEAGRIYNEMALAKELNISRTPVREALLELAVQGLVVFHPRKGVRVVDYTPKDVEEIFQVRSAMELFAVDKAARESRALDLGRVEEIIAAQEKALARGGMRPFMDRDRSFHLIWAELIDNRRMIEILKNLRDMVHIMGLKALAAQGRATEVVGEHRRIFQAVRAGRADQAREAVALHLDRSREAVLARMEENAEKGAGDEID